MARTPRPVDPDEGPVQAFAVDLRALRESAGNPTYRTLAKTAGYSATTLGDAAGGTHLPTLEVALAYAGACGGDAEVWRARWQEVNRQVARERAGREEKTGPDTAPGVPAEAGGSDATAPDAVAEAAGGETAQDAPAAAGPAALASPSPAPAARGRLQISGPWIAVLVAALAGALVAALTGAFSARQPGSAAFSAPHAPVSAAHSGAAASAHCPAVPAPGTAVAFTGMTYGLGANVRTGASLQAPVRFRIPPGCAVGFSGYCLGDVVTDETAGTPDMRWFIIPGVGEVASAIVHGDPPGALSPRPCPQDVPGPAAISLGVASTGTGGGVAELTATGSRLWIVGFAAYYGAPGGVARWHQFGFGDAQTGGAFASAPLRLGDAAAAGAAVPVVAVACLGGGGPTGVLARAALRPSAPQTLLPAPALSAASLAAAAQAACAYPGSPAGS